MTCQSLNLASAVMIIYVLLLVLESSVMAFLDRCLFSCRMLHNSNVPSTIISILIYSSRPPLDSPPAVGAAPVAPVVGLVVAMSPCSSPHCIS